MAILLNGFFSGGTHAQENTKHVETVEQSIDGAMQLFEAQRKERMAIGLKAMAKVLPYLFMGPMGIDSRQVLFKRIEEVEEASRFASVMAVMHRDLEKSLLRMLKDQGAGKQAAQARVAAVMAKLKVEKMQADYEAEYLVMEALNRVYEYLDNNWGQWKLYGKSVEFGDEKLDVPYQVLIDRLGETVDRMDAIQNAKADTAVPQQAHADATAPLTCELSTKALPEGAVEVVVTVQNQSRFALKINKPSIATVTWVLADNQVIGAHPGRPPEQILLGAGESTSFSDRLDLPPGEKTQSAEVQTGIKQGVLKCQ